MKIVKSTINIHKLPIVKCVMANSKVNIMTDRIQNYAYTFINTVPSTSMHPREEECHTAEKKKHFLSLTHATFTNM